MILKNINSIESVSKADSIRVSKVVSFIPRIENNKLVTTIKDKEYNLILKDVQLKYLFSTEHNDVYPVNTIKPIYKDKTPKDISKYWNVLSPEIKIKGTIVNKDIIIDVVAMNKTYEREYKQSIK
jgi:hypothetical protein